jgi:PAS domain-containing protein
VTTGRIVVVNDRMQRGYRYVLTEHVGRNFDPRFAPELTPKEMLKLGVFCGKYLTDTRGEFPEEWFTNAKLAPSKRDCSLDFFGVDASQPLSVWREEGWIHPDDPRGGFQWYCRYFMGRRINRWKAMRRHLRHVEINCEQGDLGSRKRQRQALLHWAYDSRKL